ncbi:hypothetical protein LSAT2_001324 [Lamellibrachia satsuma]|nr:hypothetical protein LSAT2_001324 [Lamellibrachia satsuma]
MPGRNEVASCSSDTRPTSTSEDALDAFLEASKAIYIGYKHYSFQFEQHGLHLESIFNRLCLSGDSRT